MEVNGLVNFVNITHEPKRIENRAIVILKVATGARINVGHFTLPTLASELFAVEGQSSRVLAESRN